MITTFDPTALAEPVQSTVDAYQAATGAAAIVARVSGPSQSAVDAAGLADLATGRFALPEQTFEVGSQTKMMTATIILQLVGEGKIDLDAAAASYLPATTIAGIANAETATVRQLLNMTSGIANYTDVPSAADPEVPAFVQALLDHPDRLFDAADALDLVRGQPAGVGPGAAFNYSNTNYVLLGQIIEQQTGQSFAASLQDRIFDPLGMASSTTDAAPIDPARLHSYVTLPDGEVLDVTSTGWLKGAEGGVVSTTADMTRFLKALLVDKSLLPPDLLAEMTGNAIDTSAGGVQSSFGLGIASFHIDGIGWVSGFTGGTLGTDSSTYVDLATGRIIAVGITGADANSPVLVNELWLATRTGAWNAVAFDPAADVVRIEQASAASAVVAAGDDTVLKFGPASLTLASAIGDLTTANIRFADGSVLVVGDNAIGSAGDEAANTIDIARQFAGADGKSNQLIGLGGNDRLFGGSGADRILGGEGDDTIDGRAGDDRLADGAGNDRIRGGGGDDVITAGAGNDRYAGGTGTDTLSFAGSTAAVRVDLSKGTAFGLGADTISGVENVTGSRLADRIHGHDGVNVLRGLAGNDVLTGGNGADSLDGGIGRDILVGGRGGDRFVYRDAVESPSGAGRDVIRDFDTNGDRIDLSRIDANRGRSGDQAFKFIDGQAFHGVAGELRVSAIDRPGRASDVTVVAADIDGDGRADFQVELAGLHDLSSSDFVL